MTSIEQKILDELKRVAVALGARPEDVADLRLTWHWGPRGSCKQCTSGGEHDLVEHERPATGS